MPPIASPGGPRAVLGALAVLSLVGTGCCKLGADDQSPTPPPGIVAAPTGTPAKPSSPPQVVAPAPTVIPTEGAPAPVNERQVAGAAQILVSYKGAERAPKTILRSKEDARKRAAEALDKLKSGKATFEELVTQYSDDPISKAAGGAVGNFERNAMPPAFADATFALQVGQYSDVVETPLGFYIIKRTK
jgi:hypothetical protein